MLLLCKLWPWLAGGLIGWLISGWLARRLKHGEPPVEKIVEKEIEVERVIDNPKHLALITKLEEENGQITDLQARIVTFEKAEAEMTAMIAKEGGNTHGGLRSQFTHLVSGFRSKISDHENKKPDVIEKVVEKEVIKQVDNPAHLQQIGLLKDEILIWKRGPSIDLPAARAAGISIKTEDDFTAIEGIGPKINELIHADGIHTFRELSETDPARIQKVLDRAGSNFQMANPGTWPDQANLAATNRWPALKALQDILDGGIYPDLSSASTDGGSRSADATKIQKLEEELEAYRLAAPKGSVANLDQARAAGFKIRREGDQDDFTVIEGIGPKINELIHASGIHTYSELARTETAIIQNVLDQAGPNFTLAEPDTWPAQSDLAAKNQWEALMKWQDELDGGKE